MAGLEPKWGFDFSKDACETWHQNFPHATIYRMWADYFITLGRDNNALKIDILHLSPPCQFFSPAHTVHGKDDEMNTASLFACGGILDVTKPRIVTLEQTFGLHHPIFRAYFNSLVQMFTARNFSIRWKICPLQDWVSFETEAMSNIDILILSQGLPQRRHRLVMIAAWYV